MDPIAKAILNSLKCPICGGLIDLSGWRDRVVERGYHSTNFTCVSDPEHYGIWLVHWEQPVRLELEQVILYEGCYRYLVQQRCYKDGQPVQKTDIAITEVDAERRILEHIKPKCFNYNKHLFNFKQTNREKIVNRVKTILTFQ